jgi:hypothetical protein
MQPRLRQTLSANASQVEIIGGVAYVAAGSELRSYDLLTGTFLERLALGGGVITGLACEGLFLYTMDSSRMLRAISLIDGTLTALGSLAMPAGGGKLFVGDGIAYVAGGTGNSAGFATAEVSNPNSLALFSGVDAPNIVGRSVAANGSGLAVTVGNVRGPQGQFITALDVVDVSDPSNTGAFLTRINLSADPFSVTIGAGLAFVAGGSAGLQVVNYRSFDNQGVPPTITLEASFPIMGSAGGSPAVEAARRDIQHPDQINEPFGEPPNGAAGPAALPLTGIAEEGKLVRVSARVADDVQVRNVEFYVDGARVFSDASFPFEHRFLTPLLSSGRSNFTVRARAIDTGGNFAWSDEITVSLTPNMTPPRVVRTFPAPTAIMGAADTLAAYFNEPVDPARRHPGRPRTGPWLGLE